MSSAGKLLFAVGSPNEFVSLTVSIFSVWLVGLVLGWLLPRPKWMRRALNSKNAFMLTPPGLWLGRAAVAWNSILLVRELWYRFCTPGTFRAILRSLWLSFKHGTPFEWPSLPDIETSDSHFNSLAPYDPLRWYVTTHDLEKYKEAIERKNGAPWEKMLEKQWNDCTYTAWRRYLPNGKTEYKSVTISKNSTAQEFMDFYLDDDIRPKWDGMISEHSLLENAHEQSHRCQVVRWVRTFPFAFLSRREYVIARRVFKGESDSVLYGITKGIEHPAAPPQPGVVRMSTFYSMWRSRTIPCPNGSGQPACETTLLHFEDFGIPENLARFAVRHGMAGFVGKMVPFVETFVQQRRDRCDPYKNDPRAYGADIAPLVQSNIAVFGSSSSLFSLTPKHRSTSSSSLSSSTSDRLHRRHNDDMLLDSASECSDRVMPSMHRSSSLRGLGYMLLASGVAIAVGRASNNATEVEKVPGEKHPRSSSTSRHHHHHHHHNNNHQSLHRAGGAGGVSKRHQSHQHNHHHQHQQQQSKHHNNHQSKHHHHQAVGMRSFKVVGDDDSL